MLLGAGIVVVAIALWRTRYRTPLLFAAAAVGIMLAPALPLTISLSTTETERVVYIPTAFGALLTILTIDALLPRPSLRTLVAGMLIAAHGLGTAAIHEQLARSRRLLCRDRGSLSWSRPERTIRARGGISSS